MARLRYPTGVRPLLMDETARRRRIETRIVSALERAGFAEVILPILDYADPAEEARQAYRFVDRDGELVAIRSDFTPMVARALAPAITTAELPLRIFYRGDVIRYEPSRLGANRELFQIGAEIVGDASVGADIAILKLAAEILRGFEIQPLLVYTDVRIESAVEDPSTSLRAGTRAPRNDAWGAGVPTRARFAPVQMDDIDEKIAARLETIAAAVPPECSLHLDDVEPSTGYYTGLRFRAYDSAKRRVVAQGGRYDSLYERFGTAAPAIGFTITIDDLEP